MAERLLERLRVKAVRLRDELGFRGDEDAWLWPDVEEPPVDDELARAAEQEAAAAAEEERRRANAEREQAAAEEAMRAEAAKA